MQVVERAHHIDVDILGSGIEYLRELISKYMQTAQIIDDDAVVYNDSVEAKEIKSKRTPGMALRAYRERAGLSVTELAEKTDVKYTNISAMEHDTRVIGLSMAKKLSAILGCRYDRLIES